MKTVAVLSVQGAFWEHRVALETLGAKTVELRQKSDLDQSFDALVLPGGESTVQGKLLREQMMFEPLRRRIQNGLPVLATCAGLILLAEHIENDTRSHFATLPVTVKRNAYGRQLGSFRSYSPIRGLTADFCQEFIRAPAITQVGEQVHVLCTAPDGSPSGVRYKSQLAFAFHPELTGDLRVHDLFLSSW